MQIDGHHALTYIAARLAGYAQEQATIIAYSAQYVDDATNSGTIRFKNGAMYSRISSAHKLLDYRNADKLANHKVWIPFHFLPGNGGKPAGKNPDGDFIRKLVCHPDSYVARDMLRACVADHHKPYALHRLGITLHVYADTWAHQGFAGIKHKINKAKDISSNVEGFDAEFLDRIENFVVRKTFPLGHGAALSYPDKPYLIWEYTNGLGERVKRHNPNDYIDAVDKMCRAIWCFRETDLEMKLESAPDLLKSDFDKILALLNSVQDNGGENRHKKWIAEIEKGSFSFGAEEVEAYVAKGMGSWKYKSIGQLAHQDDKQEKFDLTEAFIPSDWKRFHDALQAHRFEVLHDILPKYGICAA